MSAPDPLPNGQRYIRGDFVIFKRDGESEIEAVVLGSFNDLHGDDWSTSVDQSAVSRYAILLSDGSDEIAWIDEAYMTFIRRGTELDIYEIRFRSN
jgi:hypothetical protein